MVNQEIEQEFRKKKTNLPDLINKQWNRTFRHRRPKKIAKSSTSSPSNNNRSKKQGCNSKWNPSTVPMFSGLRSLKRKDAAEPKFATDPIVQHQLSKIQHVKQVIESPLARYHFSEFLRFNYPHLIKLVLFRSAYMNLRLADQNNNANDAFTIRQSIELNYLAPHSPLSLLKLLNLDLNQVETQNGLIDLEPIDELSVQKLHDEAFAPFLLSNDFQNFNHRIAELHSHQQLRKRRELLEKTDAGYFKLAKDEIEGTLEVKKIGGLGTKPKWRLRHLSSRGPCLAVHSKSRVQIFSLVDARIMECGDPHRRHCMRLDVIAWSKQYQAQLGNRTVFLSAKTGEALFEWKLRLEERISEVSSSFHRKDGGKTPQEFNDNLLRFFSQQVEKFEILDKALPQRYYQEAADAESLHEQAKKDATPQQRHKLKSSALGVFFWRSAVFLLISSVAGELKCSFAWSLACSGLWVYSDYLLKHTIVVEKFPRVSLGLGAMYVCGYLLHYSSWLAVLIIVAISMGHWGKTNENWMNMRNASMKNHSADDSVRKSPSDRNRGDLEWVNLILERGWETLKRTTEDTLKEYSAFVLNDNLPPFISKMELLHCSFKRPPRLISVNVHSNSVSSTADAAVLDIDLSWHDTPDIVLHAVSKASVGTQIQLTELHLSGQLRLEFIFDGWENNIPQWPCFSALSYGFTSVPKIKFRMRAMKVDVMNVPVLSDWMDNLLTSLIATYFTYPNCVTCPDWRTTSQISQKSNIDNCRLPEGLLIVTVLDGEGISRPDRFPVLFCDIKLSGEYRPQQHFRTTKLKDPTHGKRFEWNESFGFLVDNPKIQALTIKLKNERSIGKDATFGSEAFCVQEFVKVGHSQRTFKHVDLLEKSHGCLRLEFEWKPLIKPIVSPMPLPSPTRPRYQSGGLLTVRLIRAVNLGGAATPKGCPFVRFALTHSRTSIRNTGVSPEAGDRVNPYWNKAFYFLVDDPALESLKLEVKSRSSTSGINKALHGAPDEGFLGKLQVHVRDLCRSPDTKIWQLPLDVPLTGTLFLQFVWRYFA